MTAVLADPQADVDALVEGIQAEARIRNDLARRFHDYAEGARGTAVKRHIKGDPFCEALATARAAVYQKAADLVEQLPLADAASQMMTQAKSTHLRTPPLINFDTAGVAYITARAWQFCAWKIDPSLPEVQPRWEG